MKDIQEIALQISNALQLMHQYKIVHRDIKTSNMVYDSQNKEAYIIDFGHAELLYPDAKHQFRVGTRAFRAPELDEGYLILPHSDLYSLGVFLFNLLIPHLLPLIFTHNNNTATVGQEIEDTLNLWSSELSKNDVANFRSKIATLFSSSSSSHLDPLLLKLCNITLNLTNTEPYSRDYLHAELFHLSFNDHQIMTDKEQKEQKEKSKARIPLQSILESKNTSGDRDYPLNHNYNNQQFSKTLCGWEENLPPLYK